MPNGGMMPCCLSCNWADEKDMEVPPKVFCTKHQVNIYNAMTLFCSKLSLYYAEREKEATEGERYLDNVIYMWATVGYKDPKYP